MKNNQIKKILLFFNIIIITTTAISQDFIYQADLQKTDSTGYYHIFLSPEITSKLNYKFSDIRIYDNKNNEIPYLILTKDEIYKTTKNTQLPIIQNNYKTTKKYTKLIAENNNQKKINNIVIIIENPKNAEAWLSIAGSDDLRNWNILKENARYLPEYSDSATTQIRIKKIPESNFKYYRIIIYDYNKTIFKTLKILNYEINHEKTQFVEVPKPTFSQNDTTEPNKTIINIKFEQPQYIDKITFLIAKPKNFLRKAEITKKDSISGKRIRLQYYDQKQKDFYLYSDSVNQILLSKYFAKNLYLIVNNNDDTPLKFKTIKAYQEKTFIIANLKKNTKYIIKFGNPNIPMPVYDLKFFKNIIPEKCPTIKTLNTTKNSDTTKNKNIILIKPIYLWIIFFIVIIILAIISIKMFVFAKKKNTTD